MTLSKGSVMDGMEPIILQKNKLNYKLKIFKHNEKYSDFNI